MEESASLITASLSAPAEDSSIIHPVSDCVLLTTYSTVYFLRDDWW